MDNYCVSFWTEDDDYIGSLIIKARSREKAYKKFIKLLDKYSMYFNGVKFYIELA